MVGRPKEFNEEVVENARKFLDTFDVSVATLLPTIEGLALYLHISRDTVYEWEKEDEAFSDIVKELRSRQAEKLIQNALANRYNASIAKLILSGKHGYVEKTEVDQNISGGVSISAEQAEQLIRARAERSDS